MTDYSWQAISAVVTLLAVLVALIPIFQAWSRRSSESKSLRLRLASKLIRVKSSLLTNARDDTKGFLCLDYAECKELHLALENMLLEAHVLNPEEIDLLSQIHINFELCLPYIKSDSLSASSVETIVMLVDHFLVVIEENGLMTGKPLKPWKH